MQASLWLGLLVFASLCTAMPTVSTDTERTVLGSLT